MASLRRAPGGRAAPRPAAPVRLGALVLFSCVTSPACRRVGGEDAGPLRASARPYAPIAAPAPSVAASSIGSAEAPSLTAASLPRPAASLPPPAASLPRIETEWCGEGLIGLDQETCYWLPPLVEGPPRRLLVYLHGVVPPQPTSSQKERFQRAVVRASARAGAAVLVPRGRRGVGPKATRSWWAWPTSQPAYSQQLGAIVGGWLKAKATLEAAVGAPFDRTYLAGSSNGAYFLTRLALNGDLAARGFRVDGFGAMSGGSSVGRPVASIARLESRPFYVGFGSHDAASKRDAGPLVALLRAARWPVRAAEHPLGHGAREVYLDEAFAFWGAALAASP